MSNKAKVLNATTIAGIAVAMLGLLGTFIVLGVQALIVDSEPQYDEGTLELTMPWDGEDEPAGTDDPAADDGELHDARKEVESYSFDENLWARDQTEHLDAYDLDVACLFSISYPELKGDGKHIEKANQELRAAAMKMVRTYYEDPSAEAVEQVKTLAESGKDYVPEGAQAALTSVVTYAVTYNTDHFISVVFSDEYCVGSELNSLIGMRTVNINLDTGEVYAIDDVLTVKKSMATSFVDNLVQTSGEDGDGDGVITDDECLTLQIAGRKPFENALRGRGELADHVATCFFVDGNGKVNLGATYFLSSSVGIVSGWWDVTLTDEQVESGKKDSSFWDVLEQ